jgi:precorrin-2/cobalt-factor-2 C20-methyltransferase
LNKGTLYGVSVGPGDPELITLKAHKILMSCPVIAAPQTKGEKRVALDIVSHVIDLQEKQIVYLEFEMLKDQSLLKQSHIEQTQKLRLLLDNGLDVAMLNLGDASLYSTFSYINDIVREWGYETKTIPGVTSFCAVAATLNTSLVEMKKPLHIIPAYHTDLDTALSLQGNKVLMKSGSMLGEVKRCIQKHGLSASLVANCGREDERVFEDINDSSDREGYFVTILVKD